MLEFLELPQEILITIMCHGSPFMACSIGQCNKELLSVSNAAEVWFEFCRKEYYTGNQEFSEVIDWKTVYRSSLGNLNGRVFMAMEETLRTKPMQLVVDPTTKEPLIVNHYAAGWDDDRMVDERGTMYSLRRNTVNLRVEQKTMPPVKHLAGNSANFLWVERESSLCHNLRLPSGYAFDLPVKQVAAGEKFDVCIDTNDSVWVRAWTLTEDATNQYHPSDLGLRGTPVNIYASQSYFVIVTSVGDMGKVHVKADGKGVVSFTPAQCVKAKDEGDFPVRLGCGVAWMLYITRSGKLYSLTEAWNAAASSTFTELQGPDGPWVDCCFGNSYGLVLHRDGSLYSTGNTGKQKLAPVDLDCFLPRNTVIKRVIAGYFHVVIVANN